MIKGLIQAIIVLVPAYLTDKMVYVIPMLAAVSFIAASIAPTTSRRVEKDGYKDDGTN
jgi:tartrate dehydratase beta subunit/fumarate hydratase class I family protein